MVCGVFIPKALPAKESFIQQISWNCGIKHASVALTRKFSQKSTHSLGAVLAEWLDYGAFGGLTQDTKRRCYV